MSNEMDMASLEPLIREAIRDGGQFILTPKGVSMLPTIEPIRDNIVLVEPVNMVKNDIVLYKRNSGMYVAHRIMSIKNGQYTMCGDNQTALEKGIELNQIIAKVSEVRKASGLVLSPTDIRSKRRLFVLGFRRLVKRTETFIKKLLYPIYKLIFKRK